MAEQAAMEFIDYNVLHLVSLHLFTTNGTTGCHDIAVISVAHGAVFAGQDTRGCACMCMLITPRSVGAT